MSTPSFSKKKNQPHARASRWVRIAAVMALSPVVGCSGSDGTETGSPAGAMWVLGPQPVITIGEVEGDEDYLLERVSAAALLPGGSVVVGDRGAGDIRVFDEDGIFVRKFGGAGEGPGEFRYLNSLSVSPPDTVVAFDSDLYRLATYLASGVLVSTYQAHASDGMPELYLGSYSTGDHAFGWIRQGHRDWSTVSPDVMQYSRFENEGGGVTPLATLPGMRRLRSPVPFSPHPLHGMIGDSVLLTDGLLPRIDVLDPDGVKVREILIPPIRMDVDSAWDGLEEEIARRGDSMLLGMLSDFPRLDSIPQIARLLVDDLDRLWLKKYDPVVDSHWFGREGTGGEWQVVGASGDLLATVQIPDGFLPLDVRGGRVVGLSRDDLGIERVLVFELMEEGDG